MFRFCEFVNEPQGVLKERRERLPDKLLDFEPYSPSVLVEKGESSQNAANRFETESYQGLKKLTLKLREC